MSELPDHRRYTQWLLVPPSVTSERSRPFFESASVPFILETLSTHAEIAAVGRERFLGTLAQKNSLWRDFRNYMRQALSNFSAAQSVPNRSAGLLYYYAALNFAKAELLDTHAEQLVNRRIGHGLSFSPTNAKTVAGDVLKVNGGIFPLLYQRRTGQALLPGTELPVRRLLQQVPEIGSQVGAVGMGPTNVVGLYQMIAADESTSWLLWAIPGGISFQDNKSVSATLFGRHFRNVSAPDAWRDHFAISRRYHGTIAFYESKSTVARPQPGTISIRDTFDLIEPVKSLLGLTTLQEFDAWLAPSLYNTKMIPMPPALARYALTFYASSLLRYKPQMFDGQTFPEQAHLFDAVAREVALPMLQDVLSAITGEDVLFSASGSLRV